MYSHSNTWLLITPRGGEDTLWPNVSGLDGKPIKPRSRYLHYVTCRHLAHQSRTCSHSAVQPNPSMLRHCHVHSVRSARSAHSTRGTLNFSPYVPPQLLSAPASLPEPKQTAADTGASLRTTSLRGENTTAAALSAAPPPCPVTLGDLNPRGAVDPPTVARLSLIHI